MLEYLLVRESMAVLLHRVEVPRRRRIVARLEERHVPLNVSACPTASWRGETDIRRHGGGAGRSMIFEVTRRWWWHLRTALLNAALFKPAKTKAIDKETGKLPHHRHQNFDIYTKCQREQH